MGKKAFILIDYSNDLAADNGVLSCGKPAQAIAPVACEYFDRFLQNGDFVVVCNDSHDAPDINGNLDPYHPETNLFPRHNVYGTWGVELYGQVKEKWQSINKDHPFETVFFRKMRFSAFVGTKLDIWLRSRNVDEVVLGGVCTHICVLHTAIDAYNRGYKVTLADDATVSDNDANKKFAVEHMRDLLGAKIITLADL
jgi:nicotinamidase-related amidase